MDIRTQSALLAAIVGLALGLAMLLRAGRPRVLTLFAVLAMTIGGFYLFQFFTQLFDEDLSVFGRIAVRGGLIAGALVPSAALGFFLEFLGASPAIARNGRRVALLSAIFGLGIGLTPLGGNFWARVALAAWVLASLAVSVSLLARRVGQLESRIERARLRYLVVGAIACIVLAAADFLARFDIPFPAFGPVACTLYLFFLSQTLLKVRLMDLHEFFGKVASQTVLAVILAAVFAVLTAWVQGNVALLLFNTVVGAFVLIILLEPLRAKVEERMIAIFFRERFQLLRSLTALRARMVNVIDVTELSTLVLDAFNETRRVTHASIYLLADDRPGYRLVDNRGPDPAGFLEQSAARGLLAAAQGGQKAVLLENLERRVAEMRVQLPEGRRGRDELKRINELRSALGQMKAGISVPLVANDAVIGFLNLWDERVPEAYASDEIALILEIAEQLATAVENSKLYDRMRERDRLAALGEMAAGLAHEIRNPLGAIKGAAQFLDPKKMSEEDGEFVDVIVEEVNRLNGVVSAFLDYSRPLKQTFGPTDLQEVVSRTLKLIVNDVPKTVTIKEELSETLPRVDADAEQLKQVLINLVQNAIQATGDKPGEIVIRTSKPERFGDFRAPEQVELQVSDNGPGIPADQQLNIFVPFFTTKQKGTGLGLAICQRIVKNHGGTISVQSKVGEGTTFTIRLPALSEEPAASETPPIEGTPMPALPAPTVVQKENKPSRRDRKKQKA